MNFADLTDADYFFQCVTAADVCEYWDYEFYIERWDDQYSRNLSYREVVQLRENCERILRATEGLQGE